MSGPLQGLKVIEVAMWVFVPSAGGILADMGADVIKVEPITGDPLRGLQTGAGDGPHGFVVAWENYNRGKRGITLDLRQKQGVDALKKLIANADVFITSLLPAARQRMGIEVDDLRAINPKLIYAVGSATGRAGPEAEKGGFDAISFWARSGISASVTPDYLDHPLHMPSGGFGDNTSALALVAGVSAAIAKRALTGETSVVDVSLLATSMWSMQRSITFATLDGVEHMRIPPRELMPPLVNTYRTKEGRFVWLCMLQGDRYWAGLCDALGRPDLATDPRFKDERARRGNMADCIGALETEFGKRTLAECRDVLGRQDGQWDAVQYVGELHRDPQVVANNYMQNVQHEDGRALKVVSVPMQFDRQALAPRRAPAFGEHNEEVLSELGYSEDDILNLKIEGVVH